MHAPSLPDLFHFATEEEEEEDDDGHRRQLFIIPSTSSTFLTLLLLSFLRDCLERTCGVYVPWADDDDVYLARMYFFPYFYGERTAAVCKLGGYIFFSRAGKEEEGRRQFPLVQGSVIYI